MSDAVNGHDGVGAGKSEASERLHSADAHASTAIFSVDGSADLPALLRKFLLKTNARSNDSTASSGSALLLLDMSNCNASPETVACLSSFAAQISTNLVRLR